MSKNNIIPEIIKNIEMYPYTKKMYEENVGHFGRTILKSPYLSDKSKLNIAKYANPEHKDNIEKFQRGLDLYDKGRNFCNNCLSSPNKYATDQYNLFSTSRGGRKRRKSKKNKTAKKKRNKSRKIKCNPNKLCNQKFIY